MSLPSVSMVDPIAASGTTPHHSVIDHVFRDYDIRGLAPEQISPSFALLLGSAVGNLVMEQQHQKIFVARGRPSEFRVTRGFSSSGPLRLGLRCHRPRCYHNTGAKFCHSPSGVGQLWRDCYRESQPWTLQRL